MTRAGCFTIADDHPCLPGHFPGRPIVPGVVLLDAATALILGRLPGTLLRAISAVKFLTPVLPGDVVDVAYETAHPHRLDFACTVAGRAVVRGSVRMMEQDA